MKLSLRHSTPIAGLAYFALGYICFPIAIALGLLLIYSLFGGNNEGTISQHIVGVISSMPYAVQVVFNLAVSILATAGAAYLATRVMRPKVTSPKRKAIVLVATCIAIGIIMIGFVGLFVISAVLNGSINVPIPQLTGLLQLALGQIFVLGTFYVSGRYFMTRPTKTQE